MKIAVIGPGALGCVIAALLKQGGQDVLLCDHRADRAAAIAQEGIRIRGAVPAAIVHMPVHLPGRRTSTQDLVILCVKAFQTEAALRQHQALVGQKTLAWTLQNGIGNLEAMARVLPEDRVLGGSTSLGATLEGTGRVYFAGRGDTWMGEVHGGESPRVLGLAAALSGAGLPVSLAPDIRTLIWTKLVINAGINALTALLRIKNGQLVKQPAAQGLMELAAREAVAAAQKQGLHLDEATLLTRVREVASRTADNRSSMLADVLARRRTEIEQINGAIAALGHAPANQMLADMIRVIEATYMVRQGG